MAPTFAPVHYSKEKKYNSSLYGGASINENIVTIGFSFRTISSTKHAKAKYRKS